MLSRLPHKVTIQTETRTAFGGGAYTSSWTTSSVDWANVQPIKANESYGQEKKQEYIKYRVIMRYNTNVSSNKRLLYNGNIFVIESVTDPTMRNRMMELTCRLEKIN